MQKSLMLAALLASAGLTSAQSVSITATPVTDFTVTAQINGVTTSSTMPSGVPAPFAQVNTGQTWYASAIANWAVFANQNGASCITAIGTDVGGLAPGATASKSDSDLMLELQSTSPVEVMIDVRHTRAWASNGTVTWQIDIGDDGTVEFDDQSAPIIGWTIGPYAIGPQPLRIRFRTGQQQLVPGSTTSYYTITATPYNDLTLTPAMPRCSTDRIDVLPSFVGRGLTWSAATPDNPIVAVIGTSLQPLFLSPTFATPCLLLPNVDYLVYLPSGQTFTLPLPPALRPLTFWTQGVALTPQGLAVTDATQVIAQ